MAKSASSIHFWTLWWKHISIGNMPGYIVLVTSLLPGGSLSCRRQVPLVLQQQRLRGVEKWSRLHPDWAQVSLKRFEANNKMTLQVRVRVHAKVVQGLRDAVLHRGERDREAGGGLCLPGERRVLILLLTCLCRSCPRASRPPSPAARSSTRPLPPSKSSVRKVNLVPKRKFHENVFKVLTAAFPPTSCLSSTMLRRWSSSRKWPTKCQYLRCHWNWSSWSKLIVISSKVSHIDPGVPIKLLLYAENAKGTSDPAVIDDALSSQHKHYVEGGEMMTGWLWRWWQDHCGDDDRLTVEMITQ